jgi:hypothetical protein
MTPTTNIETAKRNRKDGLVHSFVVALIITLIAFLIIFGIAIRTGFIAGEDTDTNLCRVTLAAQELSKVEFGGMTFNSPLASACKRRVIDITDDGIRIVKKGMDTKASVYLKQGDVLRRTTDYDLKGPRTQEALASHFSESMRRCWLRGLEGKVEVFNDRTNVFKGTVCLLCDETHVRLSNPEPTRRAWLSGYVFSTVMPADKDRRTYGEYLFTILPADNDAYADFWEMVIDRATLGGVRLLGFSTDASRFTSSAQSICIIENDITMDPVLRDGSYATVFFRDFSKIQTGCMAVAVVPAQKVRSLCDYVAN